MQLHLNESQLKGSVLVEPTDEHQRESAGVDRTRKSDHISMTTVLHSWVCDEQQPRREDSSEFLGAVKQKVDRRIASRFPKIAKLLLERWSRLETSRQQAWQDYRRNGSYSRRRGGYPFKHLKESVFMYRCTSV